MLRFAPRYGRISPCLVQPWQVRLGQPRRRAANDNPRSHRLAGSESDAILADALKLFAAHGFAAARHAAEQARAAHASGDEAQASWWSAVCRTLDRGEARGLPVGRKLGGQQGH